MVELSKALGIFRDKVSSVKKGTTNPFFKSKYADLPSILEVIKEPLKEAGLCLYHTIKNTEGGYVVVTTIAHEESAESISSEFPIFGGKPQEIGSSITYARRYNIQAMLDIPTEDDDANASNTATRVKTEYNAQVKTEGEAMKCSKCGADMIIKKDGSGYYCSKLCWQNKKPAPATVNTYGINDMPF